jgi:hypothetical protein
MGNNHQIDASINLDRMRQMWGWMLAEMVVLTPTAVGHPFLYGTSRSGIAIMSLPIMAHLTANSWPQLPLEIPF